MSAITLVIPTGFTYVAAALVSTGWVLLGQVLTVIKHRKLSGIKYPQLYAEKAEAAASPAAMRFNCAQRAHANTLEILPMVITTTLVAALKYPALAAAGCGIWSLGRVLYTIGYVTGDPAKRNSMGGPIGSIGLVGLLFGATWTAGTLVLSTI